MTTPNPQDLRNALNDGSIESVDSETLKKYLVLISRSTGPWKFDEGHIVIGNTLNHILLQRHIEGLNKQNAITQYLVIALTIASLIGTTSQIWYADKADKRAEAESAATAQKHKIQQPQTSISVQTKPPSSHQATSGATPKKP